MTQYLWKRISYGRGLIVFEDSNTVDANNAININNNKITIGYQDATNANSHDYVADSNYSAINVLSHATEKAFNANITSNTIISDRVGTGTNEPIYAISVTEHVDADIALTQNEFRDFLAANPTNVGLSQSQNQVFYFGSYDKRDNYSDTNATTTDITVNGVNITNTGDISNVGNGANYGIGRADGFNDTKAVLKAIFDQDKSSGATGDNKFTNADGTTEYTISF